MDFQGQKCNACGEEVASSERHLRCGDDSWSGGPKNYHFHCADYEIVSRSDKREEWVFWKLQQMEEANSRELEALRTRTMALYVAVTGLMRVVGLGEDQIVDFNYDYGWQEPPPDAETGAADLGKVEEG